MAAYYNEIDPYAAEWLRTLIMLGHIADGEVDTRSISEVCPDDVRGFTQCHWFAGIGGWSHALRLAGWSDDRPVWTGSCPCQPFSVAGRAGGFSDQRHLWPHWFHLIKECRPRVIFGEQVDAAIRLGWLDLVQDDMEGVGYAFAPVGLPAAGVGAPHIRQRLWFVADAMHAGRSERGTGAGERQVARCGGAGNVADAHETGLGQQRGARLLDGVGQAQRDDADRCGEAGGVGHASGGALPRDVGGQPVHGYEGSGQAHQLGDTGSARLEGHRSDSPEGGRHGETGPVAEAGSPCGMGDSNRKRESAQCGILTGQNAEREGSAFWADAEWIWCRDGKWRPVEPGTFPLAHGVSNRVGRLRAYGNAIVPQVAAEVIGAYLDVRG